MKRFYLIFITFEHVLGNVLVFPPGLQFPRGTCIGQNIDYELCTWRTLYSVSPQDGMDEAETS